jgi:hypothetical protein
VPIEIGWAFADPETGEIQVESHLIRPAPEWHIATCWDKAAESLHGINCGQLYTEGSAPADIVRRMNEALGGRDLYSDAPAWDGDWLRMIVEAADVKPSFSVSRVEAHTLIGIVAREQAWEAVDCLAIMEKISCDVPRTHRAAADARHLAALWLAMKQGASPET